MSFSLSGALGGGLLGTAILGPAGGAIGGLMGGGMNLSSLNPFSSPSAPQSPDYIGAANAQGAQNRQTALYQNQIGNPNVNNSFGSQTVTYDANGVPTVNQSLNPTQQQLLNYQNQIGSQLGGAAQGLAGNAAASAAAPLDMSNVMGMPTNLPQTYQTGNPQQYASDATQAILSRVNPQLQWQQEALNTQLANQGITPGSEAYNKAQQVQGWQANDASQQAILGGYNLGNQQFQNQLAANAQNYGQGYQNTGLQAALNQQGLGEQAYLQNYGLNQLNALRQGSQPTLPQYQAFQGSGVQPAPIMAATQAQGQYNQNLYNQQMAQQNFLTGGLFGLGGTLGAAALLA